MMIIFCGTSMVEGMKEADGDPNTLLDSHMLYNKFLGGRQEDMTIGVHPRRGMICHSMHFWEGGYDDAAKLFNKLNIDPYYLEYDTERVGESLCCVI